MSAQKLRELKLYKKLQKDLTYRQKLQEKIRQISGLQSSKDGAQMSRRLNNNKKYFLQEQKNAQIERQNRILFQKIQLQGTKRHYYNKSHGKNRSSKTINSIQSSQQQRDSRKYNNLSEKKIHSHQQQSRISFQESQQLMRPKQKLKAKKMITELSPEIIDLLKSRMVQNSKGVQSQETVLFQGIAEIDSIKFKVKIAIKNKVYLLTGKNRHTEIMLKMEINEYKKFHKQVLKGNPGNIFQYLIIDKGQIRFRTLQQEEQTDYYRKQQIYKIQEQEDEENQQIQKMYKPFKKSLNQGYKKITDKNQSNMLLEQKYRKIQSFEEEKLQRQIIEQLNLPVTYKNSKSIQKLQRKQRKLETINNSRQNPQNMEKNGKFQKYRIMQNYTNQEDELKGKNTLKGKDILNTNNVLNGKDIYSVESNQVQAKNKKILYKLPYI